MQSHYLPVPIRDHGYRTVAYWSRNPSRHALLFVHGFRGRAEATWQNVPTEAQNRAECEGLDLLFYGYESTTRRARFHALRLGIFIAALLTSPMEIIARSLEVEPQARQSDFAYRKISVVAHSLGAVICRQMLLDARRGALAWRHLLELILFAPAHMGADVMHLLDETPNLGLLDILVSAVKYKVPILHDLAPGCQTLAILLDETVKALDAGNEPSLVARRVVFGEDDKIVSPNQFASDPVPLTIPSKGHINVCKPTAEYDLPVNTVISAL
jgi:pimeloyl-ACP methyl ester carboxylesterase